MPDRTDATAPHPRRPDSPGPLPRPATRLLAALGETASGVAHDFDNALTAIVAHATLVRGLDSPEARRHAEAILRAARVASQVVERVRRALRDPPEGRSLAHAAPSAPETAPSPRARLDLPSLGELVSEALAVAAIRAEKRAVQLTSDLGPMPAPFALAADPAELQQAIMNVVHNALDAARGRVHVQVGLDSPGPLEPNPTSVPPDRTAPRVLIDVDDDGPGIPTELADAIFSPYVSTKAPAEGTGLGLTLARRIAADHGGSLELARTDATGSLFRFTFPLTADLALDPPRPLTDFSVRALSTEDRPLAALVVDDEAHSREALAALLELAGFDVTAAVTPSEALGALTAKTAAFDLVITDLQLGRPAPGADAPQLPGLVLATRIAALAPTLPIIVVSGLPEHLRPKRLAHLTAAVFDKPVSPRALIETAQRLASAHRALTTNPERAP